MRTETSYIVNKTELEDAKRLGITKRKFVATMDSRTSKVCSKHNGMIVPINECVIGKTVPPLHPFCRSFMIDYIPGLSDENEWVVDKEDERLDKNKKISYNYNEKENTTRFLLDIQLFASKENEQYSDKSLLKGIKSISRSIEKHKDKIKNPELYIEDWSNMNEYRKAGLIKWWQKETKNMEQQIVQKQEILNKRNKGGK